MAYSLVRPIRDNKADFARLYPGAYYAGDIGDASHQAGPSEHNPYNHEDNRNTPGWVYAQDFGQGGAFDLPLFARWLLDQVRAGRYSEVKYVITRHAANNGTNYYGLFDVRYGWRKQTSSGHTTHIHVSYGPNTNNTPSSIIKDFYAYQQGDDMAGLNDYRYDGRDIGTMIADLWAINMTGKTSGGPHDDAFLLRRTSDTVLAAQAAKGNTDKILEELEGLVTGQVDIPALVDALLPALGPQLANELAVQIAERLKE